MRILAAILALLSTPAAAQVCDGTVCSGSGGPTYQGLGSAVSVAATEYWGVMAYSAAQIGSPAMNVTRASDSTSADLLLGATGVMDMTFCASTTCTVNTIYGQLAGNNLTYSTTQGGGTKSSLLANCLGSKPCIFHDSSVNFTYDIWQGASPAPTYGLPITMSSVNLSQIGLSWYGYSPPTLSSLVVGTYYNPSVGSPIDIQMCWSDSLVFFGSTCVDSGTVFAATKALAGVWTSSGQTLTISGSSTSGSASLTWPTGAAMQIRVSMEHAGTAPVTTQTWAEAAAWSNTALSGTDITAACHSQYLRYSLATAC